MRTLLVLAIPSLMLACFVLGLGLGSRKSKEYKDKWEEDGSLLEDDSEFEIER